MEEYIVGPWANILSHMYWYLLTMLSCTGGYCSTAFKEYRGVTQEYPLYPTIFDLVVIMAVCHWVSPVY